VTAGFVVLGFWVGAILAGLFVGRRDRIRIEAWEHDVRAREQYLADLGVVVSRGSAR
jgi:hypothetical protein